MFFRNASMNLRIGAICVSIVSIPIFAQDEAPQQTLITNVMVWDGISDSTRMDVDVLVEGNKIKQVAKSIKANDATVIDGKGGTLIPGLIDSHQHVMFTPRVSPNDINNAMTSYQVAFESILQVKKLLMMGVTTTRDLGGPSLDLARAIDQGIVDGPRIYSSGAFIGATITGLYPGYSTGEVKESPNRYTTAFSNDHQKVHQAVVCGSELQRMQTIASTRKRTEPKLPGTGVCDHNQLSEICYTEFLKRD